MARGGFEVADGCVSYANILRNERRHLDTTNLSVARLAVSFAAILAELAEWYCAELGCDDAYCL